VAWPCSNGFPQPRDLERLAGNVQSVFVLEPFRNQGFGRALVEP